MHVYKENSIKDAPWKRILCTRRGLVILCLGIVVIVAISITTFAATQNKPKGNEANEALVPDDAPTSLPFVTSQAPSNTPGPTFPISTPVQPDDEISTAPTQTPRPNESTSSPSDSPSISETRLPSPIPSTEYPTPPLPTNLPTLEPSLSPTSSPSETPTVRNFKDWVWTDKGGVLSGNEDNERFGQSVAISQDGSVLAIGSPNAGSQSGKGSSGSVHIYEWDDSNSVWKQRGPTLLGRNAGDQFGSSVAISADGSVLAVSEPTYDGVAGDRSGSVRVFVYSPFNGYAPLGQDLEGEDATDHFGIGLALSSNGRRLAVGAPYHDNSNTSGIRNGVDNNRLVSGQVKVFEWSQEDNQWKNFGGTPLAGNSHLDWFGWSLSLNNDGSLICAGAPRNLEFGGYVSCYESSTLVPEWLPIGGPIRNTIGRVRYDDNFGSAISLSSHKGKHRLAVGSPGKNNDISDAGLVVVYELNHAGPESGKIWKQIGDELTEQSPGDGHQMGSSLDLNGNLLAIGIPGVDDGRVMIHRFREYDNQWILHPGNIQGPAGSNFGVAVKLSNSGDLAVGATQSSTDDNFGTLKVLKLDR